MPGRRRSSTSRARAGPSSSPRATSSGRPRIPTTSRSATRSTAPARSAAAAALRHAPRPLADCEVLAGTEAPRPEAHVGVVAKDRADVLADGLGALRALADGVVLEHDLRVVHRCDRAEVLPVPGVVVALDE